MDAVKFIEERKRYCLGISCVNCYLKKEHIPCGSFNDITRPKELVKFIEEWSEKNPIKTNGDRFKEVFGIKRAIIGTKTWEEINEWWNQEYKEPEDK